VTAIPVQLRPHFNAVAATSDNERAAGAFNAWGNSFPAEEFPYGATLTINGVPFELPESFPGTCDHLEALGQVIECDDIEVEARAVALLCCGEMGEQELTIEVESKDSARESAVITARPWLISRTGAVESPAYCANHLHYSGDYELRVFIPALWFAIFEFAKPLRPWRLVLGTNPLFHLFAMTLLRCER
jgi:hypothetical protein